MASPSHEEYLDDFQYFARIGDWEEFNTLKEQYSSGINIPITQFLESIVDPESGNSILHMAAANGHHEFLSKTLKEPLLNRAEIQQPMLRGIVNRKNKAGNTALHWAAMNGHLECVKTLLEFEADSTVKNRAGHDAVYEAEINDRREIVEWVLREGGEGLEVGVKGEEDGEEVHDGGERSNEGDVVEEVEKKVEKLDLQDGERGKEAS